MDGEGIFALKYARNRRRKEVESWKVNILIKFRNGLPMWVCVGRLIYSAFLIAHYNFH